jgi:hypothetical protein
MICAASAEQSARSGEEFPSPSPRTSFE